MSSMPTLSVIMSNYNDAKTLPRAIDAIVSQSRRPEEFFIVDDGSTDNSVELIEEYVKKYPWIKFYRNERNMGLHFSIEKLFALISGDFFYGASANDYIIPDFFKIAMEFAEKCPDAGIISGKIKVHDSQDNFLNMVGVSHFTISGFYSPEKILNYYFYRENPGHSLCGATIYNTKISQKFGGYLPELGSFSDTFLARALAMQAGMIYLARPCTVWIRNEESISGATRNDVVKYFQIIRNCSALMRSDNYQDLFPEEYVFWWEKQFELYVLNYSLRKNLLQQLSEEVQMRAPWGKKPGKVRRVLFSFFIRLEVITLLVFYIIREKFF